MMTTIDAGALRLLEGAPQVGQVEGARLLIHDYFGVDFELVWDVVRNRVPQLRGQIASILKA